MANISGWNELSYTSNNTALNYLSQVTNSYWIVYWKKWKPSMIILSTKANDPGFLHLVGNEFQGRVLLCCFILGTLWRWGKQMPRYCSTAKAMVFLAATHCTMSIQYDLHSRAHWKQFTKEILLSWKLSKCEWNQRIQNQGKHTGPSTVLCWHHFL